MEKTQFETLMLAITGLDAKLSTKMDQGFSRVDQRLDRIEKDIKAIREQTALNSEEITELKQGKTPSA